MKKEDIIAEFKEALGKSGFAAYVQTAHQDGRLKEILPDVDKLFLVSEKTDDGKVNTVDKQVVSVLEKGDNLSAKCKYALLLFNVSKAYTSKDLQPLMPVNYGPMSVGIIDRISEELKMPGDYNEFAMMFARYHTLMQNPDRMGDSEAYDLVKKCEEINGRDDFLSCAQVFIDEKAAHSKDSSFVKISFHKCEERLKGVFADVKNGNDAQFYQAKMDEYRDIRDW